MAVNSKNSVDQSSIPVEEESDRLINSQLKHIGTPVSTGTVQNSSLQPKSKQLLSAKDLMSKPMTDLNEIVKGMIVQGLTLLAGAPKAGKSWLACALGLAVATGSPFLGELETVRSSVLYLALEDSERRLKKRLEKLCEHEAAPDNLFLRIEWPFKFGEGLDILRKSIQDNPSIKLVIIDVFRKFCPGTEKKNIYQQEYDQVAMIKKIADSCGIAILLIHHTNKSTQSENVFERISGTNGLTGACDSLMVLVRDRNGLAKLHTTGRDIEGEEYCLVFDSENGWLIHEEGVPSLTLERREIIHLLETVGKPMKAGEISIALKKNPSTTRVLLSKMFKDGHVFRQEVGLYTCMPYSSIKTE